jgi:hypothetical protein
MMMKSGFNLLYLALLANVAPGLAQAADTYSTNFNSFSAGDVQGQQGWAYPGNSPTVGTIVPTAAGAPAGAGANALQFVETSDSNLFGVANGVNGPRVTPAGEAGSKTGDGLAAVNSHFFASFDYRTPSPIVADSSGGTVIAFNPASSLSPTTADRYGFFGLVSDGSGGFEFDLSPLQGNDQIPLTGVTGNTWYQITESLTFNPGLNSDGTGNDVFVVTVSDANGNLLGTATSTDWEDGYSDPGFAGVQGPLAVDTMDFLNRFGPANQDEGEITDLTYGTDTPLAAAVPEPETLSLAAAGLLPLLLIRRRSRRR